MPWQGNSRCGSDRPFRFPDWAVSGALEALEASVSDASEDSATFLAFALHLSIMMEDFAFSPARSIFGRLDLPQP